MKFAALALAASALAFSLTAAAEAPAGHSPASVDPAIAKADPDNWRKVDPQNLFIFDTTKGRILIEAFPEVAPKHYKQFAAIIRSGDFDGTSFHRVIDGFMAPGGCPNGTGMGGSDKPDLKAEFNAEPHVRGVCS
ncbi:MAG: peptidylprolyl isomerase, partial [Hyphomonas sp.]|nr:peptidylprolyl isomerase [Hyphomonas sp.]